MGKKEEVVKTKTQSGKDYSIVIEAAIVRIIKKKKTMQKTDMASLLPEYVSNFKPSLEQINEAF